MNIVMNADTDSYSKLTRNLLHCGARCKAPQRNDQRQLLSPTPEGQARFLLNEATKRIFAQCHSRHPLDYRASIGCGDPSKSGFIRQCL